MDSYSCNFTVGSSSLQPLGIGILKRSLEGVKTFRCLLTSPSRQKRSTITFARATSQSAALRSSCKLASSYCPASYQEKSPLQDEYSTHTYRVEIFYLIKPIPFQLLSFSIHTPIPTHLWSTEEESLKSLDESESYYTWFG